MNLEQIARESITEDGGIRKTRADGAVMLETESTRIKPKESRIHNAATKNIEFLEEELNLCQKCK